MENLEDRLEAAVLAAAIVEEGKRKRAVSRTVLRWAVPAFAAAALALLLAVPSRPKDTFNDPALAYAEVERTFAYISQKIDKGVEIAAKAEEPVSTIKNIFE